MKRFLTIERFKNLVFLVFKANVISSVFLTATLFVLISTIPVFAEETVVLSSRLWGLPNERDFVTREVLKPFEKEYNCEVEFQFADDESLFERVEVQKKTNNVTTDVMIVYCSRMREWVDTGYVMDLTQLVNGWADRTFSESLDKMTIFDDKRYFVPIGADVYLLVANKKALKYLPERADVQDLTWEQVVDWSITMATGEHEGKYAVTGVPQKALIYQYGGVILSYGGAFPIINSPEALQAWELLVKMKEAYTPNVLRYANLIEPMKREEAWSTVAHCAHVGTIYSSNPEQFIIAPAPKGPAGIGSVAGTSGFAIMKDAPHKELAIKLVEYMTRPDIQLKIAKGTGGFIPPVKESLELLDDNLSGDRVQDEVIQKAIQVMNNGALSFIPPDYGPNWNAVKLVYDNAFRRLVLETGIVDKAYLDKAQTTIESYKIK